MAFKPVNNLDCPPENTISVGGVNKKTGKANPKSIEGYYLGFRTVPDAKKKSGTCNIYIFQTSKGNYGVWGKTNMDRQMASAIVGTMVRITYTGMRDTANGPMYIYSVEEDRDNTIVVDNTAPANLEDGDDNGGDFDAGSDDTDDLPLDADPTPLDETPAPRAQAPRTAAPAPDKARQQKVQDLLNRGRQSNKVA